MTRQQYLIMKKALEDEYKKHLATRNLEAAAIVAQMIKFKCPEMRHGTR